MKMEFVTLKELSKELEPKIAESKRLHDTDGLYNAEDIKVYVDMFRKSITRHQGTEFASGRIAPEQLAEKASKALNKTLEVTKVDKYGLHPTVHLKEVKAG
jgi:hypothetical protein